MKVLITVPRLALPGGVANYYKSLRPFLDADKVYFEVGSTPAQKGVWAGIGRLIADYRNFDQLLRANSFDLVHINPSLVWGSVIRDGVLLLIARRHGCKVLVFFRGWETSCETSIRRYFLSLFRRTYGGADAFVVLGEEFRQALITMGINAPIYRSTTVANNAIFATMTSSETSRPHDGESASEEKPFTILFLSRLAKGKGLTEAIEAFAHLKAHRTNIALMIAGDGPERSNAEKLVRDRDLSGVRFIGHVDGAEKDLAFRTADAFFFPTFFGEGMPNSVLEAMAYGLPVVTRNVGGLRDFFESGVMGYCTDSGDPATFAGLLDRLIADPEMRHRFGEYNRQYALTHFAAPAVSKKLQEIYAQVVESH